MSVKSEIFDFPVYESQVKLLIGDTLIECCNKENLPWEEDIDSGYDAYVQRIRGIIYIVLRRNNTRQTILHECIHAIDQIYTYITAEIDPKNDEIYARDVSYLQEQVLKIFENETNSNK